MVLHDPDPPQEKAKREGRCQHSTNIDFDFLYGKEWRNQLSRMLSHQQISAKYNVPVIYTLNSPLILEFALSVGEDEGCWAPGKSRASSSQ